MRNSITTFAFATLIGFGMLLQPGCKQGAQPGTAELPKDEIFNIKYAIKKADPSVNRGLRIARLCSAYDAAGDLAERWPDDPTIEPFLKETAETRSQIPGTVFYLSIDANDFEAFTWALDRPATIKPDARTLMSIWMLGPK